MRRWIGCAIAMAVAGLTISIAQAAPLSGTSRMTPEKYAAYLERFNRGDDSYGEFYAPSVVFDHGPFYGVLRGRSEILAFYHKIRTELRETVTPTMVVIDNERGTMAAELTTRLTATRDGVKLRSGTLNKGETFVSYGTAYYTFDSQGRMLTIRGGATGAERVPAAH